MKQLVHIHGGATFDSPEEYLDFLREFKIENPKEEKPVKWRDRYKEFLGDDWEIIRPHMPGGMNNKYREWVIWFEKYLPYIRDDVVFTGHSLGATFLVKYLANNSLSVRILQIHLLAGPFGRHTDFVFEKSMSLKNVSKQCLSIFIYHSKDDPDVPFEHAQKFKEALPSAELVTFEDKGHLLVPELPELIERIKK